MSAMSSAHATTLVKVMSARSCTLRPPMGTMGDQALIRFSIDGTDFNVRTVQVALDGCRVLRRAKCTI